MSEMKIDRPHGGLGQHVDIIVPLPEISGVQQIRINTDGKIADERVGIKGGKWQDIDKK